MSRGAGGGAPHSQLGFQAPRKWFSTRSSPGGEDKPQSTPSARPWVPNGGTTLGSLSSLCPLGLPMLPNTLCFWLPHQHYHRPPSSASPLLLAAGSRAEGPLFTQPLAWSQGVIRTQGMLEVKEGRNKSHLVPTSPCPTPTPQPRWLPQHQCLWPCCLPLVSWPLIQWAAFRKLTKARL